MKHCIDKAIEHSIARFLLIRRILNILILLTLLLIGYNLVEKDKIPSTYANALGCLVIMQVTHFILGRTSITYNTTEDSRFIAINDAMTKTKTCKKLWATTYGKTKAYEATLKSRKPNILKTNIRCLIFKARRLDLKAYFLPDKLVIIKGIRPVFLDYSNIVFEKNSTTGSRKVSDAKIHSQDWAHQRKDGGRDKRYKNNYLITTYRYGVITIKHSGTIMFHIVLSNEDIAYPIISQLKKAKFKTNL